MMEENPWFKCYDAGVPKSLLPYPDRTLMDYLHDGAMARPNSPAILFKGTQVTLGDLDRLSNAFAAALIQLGIKKGDRLALLLPNCPQFLIAQFGGWKAGAVLCPLNPLYTERELEDPLVSNGAEIIVTLTPFYSRIKSLQPNTKLRHVIATNIKEYLPPLLRILFTVVKEKKEGHRVRLQKNDFWFQDLIESHVRTPKPEVHVGPEDPAVILLSGGTTGAPKGTVGRHRCYVISGLQLHSWVTPLLEDWRDTMMLPLPLFHVYANVGIQSTALIGHNPISLIPNPRDIKDIIRTISKVRPAFFISVPTLFIAILNHPDAKARKVDFRSIKLCISGASALMAKTKESFEAMTGGTIAEGYSLTEAMMACVVNPALGRKKTGSIGLPVSDVEVRIADPDDGDRVLPSGQVGEILMRAPQLMTGYWQNEAETALALRSHGEGPPWLHTGDLGYMDEDGYILIVDRKKDVIKPSGFQVWPREVEEVIASHPAVAEVGVAGIPDDYQVEAVKAWIVLRPGKEVTPEEIRLFCRQNLAPYKVPKHVEFRESLPKTMAGKVLRRELASEERRRMGKT